MGEVMDDFIGHPRHHGKTAHLFRCDICGQFISYADLWSRAASYEMIDWDHWGTEIYRGRCSNHKEVK